MAASAAHGRASNGSIIVVTPPQCKPNPDDAKAVGGGWENGRWSNMMTRR
jgi:hypothetical protein